MNNGNSPTLFAPLASPERPFRFQSGEVIDSGHLAYKTYGKLDPERSNAVVVFPVLTTSHHVAGFDSAGDGSPFWTQECHRGWWDGLIGPGKAIDTDHFFVICANYLGGCYGSLGPETLDPGTGKKYGARFPKVTVEDMVHAQMRLIDQLGIPKLHAVIGASFGGLLAYDLSVRFAERVQRVISIASGSRVSPEARHSNLAQIMAIETDSRESRSHGLKLARLIAMRSYVELAELDRNLSEKDSEKPDTTHSVEAFFLKHAERFAARFSPHSYLRIVGAWQRFRPAAIRGAGMGHQQWLLFSIERDACFPRSEQDLLAAALDEGSVRNESVFVPSGLGHDAFLSETEKFAVKIRDFLAVPPPKAEPSFFSLFRGENPRVTLCHER
jgi:homoserine O-acetyltransferase